LAGQVDEVIAEVLEVWNTVTVTFLLEERGEILEVRTINHEVNNILKARHQIYFSEEKDRIVAQLNQFAGSCQAIDFDDWRCLFR
jgi:uncharacterized protein YqgV (UPF0045/DUF77 family)